MNFSFEKVSSENKRIMVVSIFLSLFFGWMYFSNIGAYNSLMFDEAGYITLARTLATQGFYGYDVTGVYESYRPPLFVMILAAAHMIIGVSYLNTKIPIILLTISTIIFIFLWISKKFGIFVGMSSAIFFGASPIILQNVEHILAGAPTMIFYSASLFFFYRGINNKKNSKNLYFAWFFFAVALLMRSNALLIPISFAAYMGLLILAGKLKIQEIFTNKNLFISPLTAFLVLMPYFIYQKSVFNDAFVSFRTAKGALNANWGLAPWYQYIAWIPQSIGLIVFICSLIGIGYIAHKDKKFAFFLIAWAVPPLIYFSSFAHKEYRYLITIIPVFAILAGIGIYKCVFPWLKRDIKNTTAVHGLLAFLVLFSVYSTYSATLPYFQNVHAIGYPSLEKTGSWIQENTPHDSLLITATTVGHMWYSKRNVTQYPNKDFDFFIRLDDLDVDYIVIDNYERNQPQYVMQFFAQGFFNEQGALRYPEDALKLKIFGDLSHFNDPSRYPVTIVIPADLFVLRTKHLGNISNV